MPPTPRFVTSIWFSALVALLVALGSQVLIEALTPITAFDLLFNESRRQGPIALIAGESFWREDSVIRGVAFGVGAFVGCVLAKSHSWRLLLALVSVAILATVFAQFPRPASLWQLTVWASSAPAATLLVFLLLSARKGNSRAS